MDKVIPDYRLFHGRARQWAYDQQKRAKLYAQGLTARGIPRQKQRWPEFVGLSHRARRRAYMRVYREKMRDQGLTSRGTKPKYRVLPPKESAWRELRAQMNIQEAA